MLPRFSIAAFAALLATRALACVAVEQDRVFAKDLVQENSWFARLDPNLQIAITPLAGITRVIRNSDLAVVARRNLIAATAPSLPGLCVEREAAPLTLERLQPVVERVLGRSPVRIVDYSRYSVPRGEIEFARAGPAKTGLWRGRVIYGQSHSAPVWVKVAMEVAAADSAAGKSREVELGEQVTVEVTSGAARLAFQAVAASSGHAGDSVLVRNPANGRLFQAKVLGDGKVLIHR